MVFAIIESLMFGVTFLNKVVKISFIVEEFTSKTSFKNRKRLFQNFTCNFIQVQDKTIDGYVQIFPIKIIFYMLIIKNIQ